MAKKTPAEDQAKIKKLARAYGASEKKVAQIAGKAERTAQAQEYFCSLSQWDKACQKSERIDGAVAVCTVRAGHPGVCLPMLPKGATDKEYDAKVASKMCRELSGHEGEEVRCVLPLGHSGQPPSGGHSFPTGEEAREQQLKRYNLADLIEDTRRNEEQRMANKKAETTTEAKTSGRKGNPEALKKAREARESKREPDKRKVKILVKENPKKGNRAARFSLYKNGMTVDEYCAAGGKRKDVQIDIDHQYISVK